MSFKNFDLTQDIVVQPTIINEIIGITGSLFSGSNNIQYYNNIFSGSTSGGFWISLYDDAVTSISSSALLDVFWGASVSSSLINSTAKMFSEKQRIYKEFAQVLLGNKSSIFSIDSANRNELFFVTVKRRIFKNGIKKGNISFKTHLTASRTATTTHIDTNAVSSFTVGIAGEFANLSSSTTGIGGLAYYDAAILVLIPDRVFSASTTQGSQNWSGSATYLNTIQSGTFDNILEGFRLRWENLTFHNKTELNSTYYYCRALNNEFNYSSNPTFLDSEGRILVCSGSSNTNKTRTFITTIGLYNASNELMAVAKVSEPIRKTPTDEFVFKTRLDY